MRAIDRDYELLGRLQRFTDKAIRAHARILRRAEQTLHRWCQLECGDGNDYASWSIERDEQTGKPFMVTHPHQGKSRRRSIPDREKGALIRVEATCLELGLHFWYQTDPRGCALYVSNELLTDMNYTNGLAI